MTQIEQIPVAVRYPTPSGASHSPGETMPKVFLIEGIERHSEGSALRQVRADLFDHLGHDVVIRIQESDLQVSNVDEAAVAGMRHRQIVDSMTRMFELDIQFVFPGEPKPKGIIADPLYRGWSYGFLSGRVYEDFDMDPGDQVHNGIIRIAPMLDFKHGVVLYHSARIQMGSTPEAQKHSTEELKKSTVLWGAYVSEGVDLLNEEDNPYRMRRHVDA